MRSAGSGKACELVHGVIEHLSETTIAWPSGEVQRVCLAQRRSATRVLTRSANCALCWGGAHIARSEVPMERTGPIMPDVRSLHPTDLFPPEGHRYLYIVVWGGGYDCPSYAAKGTLDEATALALEWAAEMDEDRGDSIDVLRLDLTTLEMERMTAAELSTPEEPGNA